MWARFARTLRRMALLLSLCLTAIALVTLPRLNLQVPVSFKSFGQLPIASTPEDTTGLIEDSMSSEVNEGENEYITLQKSPLGQRLWFFKDGGGRPVADDTWNPKDHKLFPEEAPGDDRIVNQLMFTIPKTDKVLIKNILLAHGFESWNVKPGRTEFLRNKCPVDQCSLSANPHDSGTADAILHKDHHKRFYTDRPQNQIWILYYLECPYHTMSLPIKAHDVFNWTATYRRDSDIVTPYERWVYYDPEVTARDLDRNYAANKTKKVAWFVSNCHARNRRLQYALALSKHIQVDIYGACGSHHCPRSDPYCLEMLNKDYKFYLAFENSNCRDYITEKFFVNGLSHDILPIVMGARAEEYAAVAPHNSYLHVDEFTSPEELARYLNRLDRDDALYNSYFRWKSTGEFVNTFFFCRVCAMLHANDFKRRHAHYTNVQEWWRDGACSRGEWRTPRDNG